MALSASQIVEPIRRAAPESTAAAWDNVGFQIGRPSQSVESVVVALEVVSSTIERAVREEAGLIIAHHPLLFHPINRIDPSRSPGKEITALVENGVALYAAHTNVDRSPALSMNAEIGRILGIPSAAPLGGPWKAAETKLVVFVPPDSADAVREALASAGAGVIGDYSHCSFSLSGRGTFLGSDSTNPSIGRKGRLESVDEIRLEMVVPPSAVPDALNALRAAHPYEEPAFDLTPLSGVESESQFVWIGELPEPIALESFAQTVAARLGGGFVKYAGDPDRIVRRAAWTSGSGRSLIGGLDPARVDVFLTGDTGHHDAHDCLARGIALVDCDHYSTERLFPGIIRRCLESALPADSVRVIEHDSGPVYRTMWTETDR